MTTDTPPGYPPGPLVRHLLAMDALLQHALDHIPEATRPNIVLDVHRAHARSIAAATATHPWGDPMTRPPGWTPDDETPIHDALAALIDETLANGLEEPRVPVSRLRHILRSTR